MTTLNDVVTPSRWLSWEQASAFSTLSKATLKRQAQAGRLPVSRIGRRTVICRDDLDAFLDQHRTTGPATTGRGVKPSDYQPADITEA
jgi:excisionase family DNA binding protein